MLKQPPCLPGLFDQGPQVPYVAPQPPSPRESDRETGRRLSNKDRVLARLREGAADTMALIAVGGARAAARAWELQQEGYPITVEDHGGGKFVYSLKG
jgi:hypothetical protein